MLAALWGSLCQQSCGVLLTEFSLGHAGHCRLDMVVLSEVIKQHDLWAYPYNALRNQAVSRAKTEVRMVSGRVSDSGGGEALLWPCCTPQPQEEEPELPVQRRKHTLNKACLRHGGTREHRWQGCLPALSPAWVGRQYAWLLPPWLPCWPGQQGWQPHCSAGSATVLQPHASISSCGPLLGHSHPTPAVLTAAAAGRCCCCWTRTLW